MSSLLGVEAFRVRPVFQQVTFISRTLYFLSLLAWRPAVPLRMMGKRIRVSGAEPRPCVTESATVRLTVLASA